MAICTICGKKYSTGVSQRHRRGIAGKRWSKRAQETKRTFSPNIQSKTFIVSGVKMKMKVCTDCLSKIKKSGRIKSYTNIAVA